MNHPLDLTVRDIRLRQWEILQAALPVEPHDSHNTRMSAAMTRGLAIVHDMSATQPHLRDLMIQIMTLAERDPRLAFLQAIPNGPILAMMRATTLERAAFGTETNEVAEMALLIGLFTVLLDGLLDEAPELLAPARSWLDRLMTLERPPGDIPSGLHPVTEVLAWAGAESVGRLSSLDGWQDPVVREEFTRATLAAYQTELTSLTCRITDTRVSQREQRTRIVAKSSACIWAGALIPTVIHGWPADIDPRAFETLARAIGEFGGWVDDIVDLADDLRADRWSMPLLEIHAIISLLDTRLSDGLDPRPELANALQHPFIAGKLPALGVNRLDRVRDALARIRIPEDSILPVLGDVAWACLLDDLVPA
ncbi:MAG TPA: hypothetical protein VNZ58_12200 [Thermomicrobiales bacterium]|nr:hypothetical protein [Thermomicrobiales bacterium]